MLKRTEMTGPRAELQKSIDSRDAAAKRINELRASIARIEDERFAARQKLAATAREADESNGRDDVIERLLAGETSTAVLERAADRKEVTAAESEIETSNRALSLLRAELAGAEQSLELRTNRVRDAAGAVIATEALDAIVDDATRLRGELAACEAVLSFVHSLVRGEHKAKVERALVSSEIRGEHPSVAPWRAAFEELARDAAAELPR